MSTAGLAPTDGAMPAGNELQVLFWNRLSIGLYGNDAAYDAWNTLAQSGDDDDKWFAARYSGYVMMFTYQNTDAISTNLWLNSLDGNGWCIQDARESTLLGGYCLFPVQSTADGSAAVTLSMTNA